MLDTDVVEEPRAPRRAASGLELVDEVEEVDYEGDSEDEVDYERGSRSSSHGSQCGSERLSRGSERGSERGSLLPSSDGDDNDMFGEEDAMEEEERMTARTGRGAGMGAGMARVRGVGRGVGRARGGSSSSGRGAAQGASLASRRGTRSQAAPAVAIAAAEPEVPQNVGRRSDESGSGEDLEHLKEESVIKVFESCDSNPPLPLSSPRSPPSP